MTLQPVVTVNGSLCKYHPMGSKLELLVFGAGGQLRVAKWSFVWIYF
jgi:hypothetical protein